MTDKTAVVDVKDGSVVIWHVNTGSVTDEPSRLTDAWVVSVDDTEVIENLTKGYRILSARRDNAVETLLDRRVYTQIDVAGEFIDFVNLTKSNLKAAGKTEYVPSVPMVQNINKNTVTGRCLSMAQWLANVCDLLEQIQKINDKVTEK